MYEWNPAHKEPIPEEKTIKIKYKNIGTQNSYWAKHVLETKINTIGIDSKVEDFISGLKVGELLPPDRPIFSVPVLHPLSSSHKGLKFDSCFSESTYKGMKRTDYVFSIKDEKGNSLDTLKGIENYPCNLVNVHLAI